MGPSMHGFDHEIITGNEGLLVLNFTGLGWYGLSKLNHAGLRLQLLDHCTVDRFKSALKRERSGG